MLWCLSADDGQTHWKQPLNGESAGMAIGSKQVIAWNTPEQLRSFDLASGRLLWKRK